MHKENVQTVYVQLLREGQGENENKTATSKILKKRREMRLEHGHLRHRCDNDPI